MEVISIEAITLIGEQQMAIIGSRKVTIDIPIEEYQLLEQIKDATGKSIRALVREGVPIVILNHEKILIENKQEMISRADNIESALSKLKKQ